MAAFSYNYYSGDSYMHQYRKYLQNQNYVNQIDTAIRETGEMNAAVISIQAREVQNAIQSVSQRQSKAIEQASDAICSTLESGFSDLNYNLGEIKDGISDLTDLVGHGFSMILEGQKITNQYLGQIQNLLKIPDSQKQRVYHIEEGLKYLQNAFRQSTNSEFYADALDEFKKSEAIEKKDFISLFYIGFIYLKASEHLDPKASEIYFRKSARYYLAEALVSGTNVSKNLLQSQKGFLLEAAQAYLFAAEACYIQENFSEAIELAAEAWKTYPKLTKAGFLQAKYLAANNQADDASTVLEKAIRINRYLSREVRADLDLTSKPEIINLIAKLRAEAVQEAKAKYEFCRKIIIPNSAATSYLLLIEKLIKLETFLEAKEATDLLLTSKIWTISSGADITSQGQVIAKISSQEFTGSVIDFVKFEKERVSALPEASALIRIDELEGQKQPIQEEIKALKISIDYNNEQLRWAILQGLIGIGIFVFPSCVQFSGHLFLYSIVYIVAIIWTIIILFELSDKSSEIGGFLVLLFLVSLGLIIFTSLDMKILSLASIFVFSKILSKSSDNTSMKSEIVTKQKNIEKMNNEIKDLNKGIKIIQ